MNAELRTRTIPKRPPSVVWVEYHAPECGYANRVHTSGRALGVVVCTCAPVAYKCTSDCCAGTGIER